jgi:predicted component of type VI protein secretion system
MQPDRMDWLNWFEQTLVTSNNLELKQSQLDDVLQLLNQTKSSPTEVAERVSYLLCLLTERKFLVSLVHSLVCSTQQLSKALNELIQNKNENPFDTVRTSSLRQIVGHQTNEAGRDEKVWLTHSPRG